MARSTMLIGALSCIFIASAWVHAPMGEETFGNKPLNAANYTAWPGLINVINDEHRVYHQWVNGSEFGCFKGDTAALNEWLKNLAEVTAERLELVLRPDPGVAQTFEKDKTVDFDWKVHLNGGVARHMATRDKGELIWHTWPVVTVHVTDRIDLPRLVIPDNVVVLQIEDLKTRILPCLKSTDQNVRGWSCGHLASLNKYDNEIMEAIAERLDDDVNWVRLNAVLALTTFGEKAQRGMVLGQIESNLDSADAQLKEHTEKSLEKIRATKADARAEESFIQTLEQIQDYCETRKKK